MKLHRTENFNPPPLQKDSLPPLNLPLVLYSTGRTSTVLSRLQSLDVATRLR